ncbi:hypothetical protein AGR6A_pb0001 [Agrobacterium sp. NCPPB 925]|nr:hypothetical protein AGR6A_pb0001 [Agrobacterium sp. NCPPB 925]
MLVLKGRFLETGPNFLERDDQ